MNQVAVKPGLTEMQKEYVVRGLRMQIRNKQERIRDFEKAIIMRQPGKALDTYNNEIPMFTKQINQKKIEITELQATMELFR